MKNFVIIVVFAISCNNQNDQGYKEKNNFNSIQNEYVKKKFYNYKEIFSLIKDTINSWKRDSLIAVEFLYTRPQYYVDSLIVFNMDSTRLFGSYISIDIKSNSIFDYIDDLGGAKINNKWYFFFGIHTAIDRATYQDSIYSPLTFDELSYLARENLSHALYKDGKGDIKVKESFFDFMDDPNGWGLRPGSTRADIDSVIVARNKEKRKRKIDPKRIEQKQSEMASSVRPNEPVPPKLPWYKKLFPKEEKLFESKEWKEFIANKNKGK